MDQETVKERILAQLKRHGVMTNTDMISSLDGDETLFKLIRSYLISNNYAKDLDGYGLVYLERDSVQGKKTAPSESPDTYLKVDSNLCPGKKENILKPPHYAFISYGRKNDEITFVTRLKKDLLASKSLVNNAFLDLDNIETAEVFDKKIEDQISDSTVFLAVISPHAIRKESICRDETVYAYNNRKPIVPIMFRFDKNSKLPLLLCRRNWIDFSSDYTKSFSALCRYLSGDPTAANSPLHPLILGKEPLDFGPEIASYSDNFVERAWIDTKIADWIQYSSNPGFVIIGNPGSGKSAISAWLSRSFQEQVIGIHFCSSLNPRSLDQMEFVGNLVTQLFTQVPEYAEIMKKTEQYTVYNNATRALRELVIEPLISIKNPELTLRTPKIIIVDSFDEAVQIGNENIFNLLLQQIDYLPPWLRIIATTRPEKGIIDLIGSKFTRLDLSDNNVNNDEDIGRYIDAILKKETYKGIFWNKIIDLTTFNTVLTRQSAGIFLYVVYVMKAIVEGNIDPLHLETLPTDLVGFYLQTFQKKFPNDSDYAPAKKILGVLIAAKEPLTSTELAVFLEKDTSEIESILRPLASLFIRNNSMQYQPYHNSLKEWLKGDGQYLVNITEGNRIITDRCWQEFENGVQTMSTYAVTYLPVHLMDARRYRELVTLLKNPKFFVKSWENNEFTVKRAWATIEKYSDFSMLDSYKEVRENPSQYPDDFVMAFSEFLTDTGHHDESINLLEYVLKIYIHQFNEDKIEYCLSSLAWALYLVGAYQRSSELLQLHEFICKNRNDTYNLQIGIGYQANLTSTVLPRSIDLNNQQEHLCRELGEKGKYWTEISVGNRGTTLFKMELTNLAFRLYQEKEQICKEIANYQGLQWAYGYQADFFKLKGDKKKALELYSQQYDIAKSISYHRGMKLSLENQLKIYETDGDSVNVVNIEKQLQTLNRSVTQSSITILSSKDLFKELEPVCADKEKEYRLSKNNRELSKILSYKAFLLEMKKDYENALLAYQEQEEIGNLIKSPIVVNNAQRNVWRVYCEKGDLRKAFEIPEKYPDAFTPLWAKYDFLNFMDVVITTLSSKKNTDIIEALLKYQIGYAERDKLIIPLISFAEHIKWAGDKNDIQWILWLLSHKTEFDIVIQYLALKKIYSKQVQQVISNAKDIARAYYYSGNFSKSYAVYDSLKGYYAITKNKVAIEKTLGEMGLNKEARGEFMEALSYYNDQADICREISLFEDLAWSICNQGDILRKLGKLDEALELYQEQEKISKEYNLLDWLNHAIGNIGNIYKDYGQYAKASSRYEQIDTKGNTPCSLMIRVHALENLADILYRTGEFEKALETYIKAGEMFTEPFGMFDQWRILTKCAVLYDTLNKHEDYTTCIIRKRQLIPSIKTEQLFSYLMFSQDHIHTIRFDFDLIYEWHEKKHILKKILEDTSPPVNISLPQHGTGSEYFLIQPEEFAMIQKIGDLCKKYKFEMGLQYYYGFTGLYETITQKSSAAQSSFTLQQEQCKKIGYREGLQISLGRIADIFYQAGDVTHAKAFTEEQLDIAKNLNSSESLLRSGQRLADILLTSKDFNSTKKHLEQILKSAKDLRSYHQIAMTFYRLGLTSQLAGHLEEAKNYFIALEETADKTGDVYLSILACVKQT